MDNRELNTIDSTETLITVVGTIAATAVTGREWAMRGGESV